MMISLSFVFRFAPFSHQNLFKGFFFKFEYICFAYNVEMVGLIGLVNVTLFVELAKHNSIREIEILRYHLAS